MFFFKFSFILLRIHFMDICRVSITYFTKRINNPESKHSNIHISKMVHNIILIHTVNVDTKMPLRCCYWVLCLSCIFLNCVSSNNGFFSSTIKSILTFTVRFNVSLIPVCRWRRLRRVFLYFAHNGVISYQWKSTHAPQTALRPVCETIRTLISHVLVRNNRRSTS